MLSLTEDEFIAIEEAIHAIACQYPEEKKGSVYGWISEIAASMYFDLIDDRLSFRKPGRS